MGVLQIKTLNNSTSHMNGGYARPDYIRYANAAVGGRYSFEYGPGGSNLEVTSR